MVLNKYHGNIPASAIFIGRGSEWGNDFSHLPNTKAKFRVATRDIAVESYRQDLWKRIKAGLVTLESLDSLHGQDLVCYCAPASCHGHVLERAAAWAHIKLKSENQNVK